MFITDHLPELPGESNGSSTAQVPANYTPSTAILIPDTPVAGPPLGPGIPSAYHTLRLNTCTRGKTAAFTAWDVRCCGRSRRSQAPRLVHGGGRLARRSAPPRPPFAGHKELGAGERSHCRRRPPRLARDRGAGARRAADKGRRRAWAGPKREFRAVRAGLGSGSRAPSRLARPHCPSAPGSRPSALT